MKYTIIPIVFLLLINTWIIRCQQQFIYTVQYAKSYRRDLLDTYMGCKQNSTIIYGVYLYPTGIKDALYVYLNQGTYQTRLSCNSQNNHVKLFGTEQDYSKLLDTDPTTVANNVKQTLARMNPTYVVSWKHPLDQNAEKSLTWLKSFVEKLNSQNQNKVYLKAPASYFCYQSGGIRHLVDININKFIVEMYGEQAGMYTSYETMFEKDFTDKPQNSQNYSESCPKFPSYQTLLKNFDGKEIFIEKTLQQEQAGYIGSKLQKFLQQSKKVYEKVVFMDSFPQQIIQL